MGGPRAGDASIQQFFLPTPSTSPVKRPAEVIGDGFTAEEVQEAVRPKPSELWHPPSDLEYADIEISALEPGPKAVTFMGRVANIFDVANSPKTPRSAKGCVKLCVKDSGGAITVRLWYATRVPNVRLGSLVSIYTNHISNGEQGTLSSANAPLFASLFPERDRVCHMMVHENSDGGTMFKTPIDYREGIPLNGLMTLQNFIDGGCDVVDAKILVVVKSIGARKKGIEQKPNVHTSTTNELAVTRKDESVTENVNLQVQDDTAHATLGLWGTLALSPSGGTKGNNTTDQDEMTGRQSWTPGETVLLLMNPGCKLGRSTYLSFTSSTVVDVDPEIPDADWLRRWSIRQKSREAINAPFPIDVFDRDLVLKGSTRCLFTIAELDEFARCSPGETFQGYLSVLIMETKLLDLWRRQMLLSGECCNIPLHANALTGICKGCDAQVELRLNPRILGKVVDETATIACGKMLFSDEAWRDLLGRGPEELLRLGFEEMKYLSDRLLFCRVTILFGWTGDETKAGGRICVLGVRA